MTPPSAMGMSEAPRDVRRLRVAHVIPGMHYGGMERLLHDLARRLPAYGIDVHIVVVEGFGKFAEGLTDATGLHQVPRMGKSSLVYPRPLIEVFRRLAPDIVHSHAGIWHKASRAARLAGVPTVTHTEHGRRVPDRMTDRLIDNVASRATDVVIAVSEVLAEVLRKRVVHDPNKVRVILNGVDVERLRPPADTRLLRSALGFPAGTPIISSIGRLQPVKNYSLALRAFARLGTELDGGPPPWLVLVGDGSEREMLESLARTLGIASRVKFLGFRDDVDRFYGAADLFTLTSKSEGTSVSLLEAMSTGLCPVVTDVGGNRAVLGPDLSESLVPSGDDVVLADVWRRLLTDAPLRRRMGAIARARVASNYSLEQMVLRHVTLYRELASDIGGVC